MPYAYKYTSADENTVYLTLSEAFVEHLIKKYKLLDDGPVVSIVSWGDDDD